MNDYLTWLPKPLFHNIVALGILGATVCHDISILEKLIQNTFHEKSDEIIAANVDVLRKLLACGKEQDFDFSCIAPPPEDGDKLLMNGNEAIASLLLGVIPFRYIP